MAGQFRCTPRTCLTSIMTLGLCVMSSTAAAADLKLTPVTAYEFDESAMHALQLSMNVEFGAKPGNRLRMSGRFSFVNGGEGEVGLFQDGSRRGVFLKMRGHNTIEGAGWSMPIPEPDFGERIELDYPWRNGVEYAISVDSFIGQSWTVHIQEFPSRPEAPPIQVGQARFTFANYRLLDPYVQYVTQAMGYSRCEDIPSTYVYYKPPQTEKPFERRGPMALRTDAWTRCDMADLPGKIPGQNVGTRIEYWDNGESTRHFIGIGNGF